MKAIEVKQAALNYGGNFTAMELAKTMYPGADESELITIRQRILCHLMKMVNTGEIHRQPSEGREVLWGVNAPKDVVRPKARTVDEMMIDAVLLRLQRNPGGMTLNDLLDNIYGVGVKIDSEAYARVKRALRLMEVKGMVDRVNNGNKFDRWILRDD